MRPVKYFLLLAFALGLISNNLIAADRGDGSRFEEELNERDFDALRDFLKSRRAVDIEERTSDLVISGDVRTEWRNLHETCNGQKLRGGGWPNKGPNDFDIEFNLLFNYIYERSWAIAHVRYDNSAGVDDNDHPCCPLEDLFDVDGCCREGSKQCNCDPDGYHGSGACDDLCLKKAYMGYNVYECGPSRFDVELGRRGNLYNVFDSNIQFLSRFDGLLLKYDSSLENVSDFYLHAAGFVIDEKFNHFGWVSELGLLNIADTNISFKYSIIDWQKRGRNRCGVRNPKGFRCLNSQFTLNYFVDPDIFKRIVKIYGAILINHLAPHRTTYRVKEDGVFRDRVYNHSANLGWYTGVLIGEVRKEGDWALEIQYQYVQFNAMPDDDCSGICRGNVLDESKTGCTRRGNTNFHGWRVECLYGLTDNITLDAIVESSRQITKKLGGSHTYSKFELEAVYAF